MMFDAKTAGHDSKESDPSETFHLKKDFKK